MPRSLAIEILSAIVSARRGMSEPEAPAAERQFEAGEFRCLEIASPFTVEVSTGSPPSVQASGPEDALESLSIETDGERLFIGCDDDLDADVRINVHVASLESVRIGGSGEVYIDKIAGDGFECVSSGSGDLFIEDVDVSRLKLLAGGSGDLRIDKVRSDEFEAMMMGSGDLSLDALESSSFKLTINGSGDAIIADYCGEYMEAMITGSGDLALDSLDSQSVKFSLFGSGDADIAGKAKIATLETVGSGEISAGRMDVQEASLSILGSGDISAHVTAKAEITVMGSGNAKVTGGGKCSVTGTGSGKIRCS